MSEMTFLTGLRRCCKRLLLLPWPACRSCRASTPMPALRVSESKRLRLRLRLILGKGVRGKPLLKNLLEPEQRVNQPNTQKPKGAERLSQAAPPKGMVRRHHTTMLGTEKEFRNAI